MEIYIQRGSESLGVYTPSQTLQFLSTGQLLDSDLVWHSGLQTWTPLGEARVNLASSTEPDEITSAQSSLTFGNGRYSGQQLLGKGGMGQVWLAYDELLERPVALKTLHKRNAADEMALLELKEEVQRCLELTHSNIIRIYDLAEPEGEDSFISMEYVSGEDLFVKLRKHPEKCFGWDEIEPYARELCEALEYAHNQGVIHRDLKPQNLMVSNENILKLADFGISSKTQVTGEDETTETARAGTPVYWSPQQASGLPPERTDDIYSLGITLYHLLTGDAPFLGKSEREITRQHVEDEPVHPQQKLKNAGRKQKIPAYVCDLILKCLAKNPADRFQRVEELKNWLNWKGDPVGKKQKRLILVAVIMGLVSLGAGGLANWAFDQRNEAESQRSIAIAKQEEAEEAQKVAEKEKYSSDIKLAYSKIVTGEAHEAESLLWNQPVKLRGWEWGLLMQMIHNSIVYSYKLYDPVFSKDKSFMAGIQPPISKNIVNARFEKRICRVINLKTGIQTAEFDAGKGTTPYRAFSSDSNLLGVIYKNEELKDGKNITTSHGIKILNPITGTILFNETSLDNYIDFQFIPKTNLFTHARKTNEDEDIEILIRETQTGAIINSLVMKRSAEQERFGVLASPNGKFLAVRQQNDVTVYNLENLQIKNKLDFNFNNIDWFIFSPNSKYLGTRSTWNDFILGIGDVDSGEILHKIKGSKDKFPRKIVFSPDNENFLAHFDTEIKYISLTGGSTNHIHKEPERFNSAGDHYAYSSNGEQFVILEQLNQPKRIDQLSLAVSYYNSKSGALIKKSPWRFNHGKILFGRNDNYLISIQKKGPSIYRQRVNVLDLQPEATIPTDRLDPWVLRDVKQDRYIRYTDREIHLSSIKSNTIIKKTNFDSAIRGNPFLAPDPKGKYFYAISRSFPATIIKADLDTGNEINRITLGHKKSVNDFSFTPNGENTAVLTKERDEATGLNICTILKIDRESQQIKQKMKYEGDCRELAISPDGKVIATSSRDSDVIIWDFQTLEKIRTLPHPSGVNSITFTPDGRLITGPRDGKLKVWDIDIKKELLIIKSPVNPIPWRLRFHGGTLYGHDPEDMTHYKPVRVVDWTLTREKFDKQKLEKYKAWLETKNKEGGE